MYPQWTFAVLCYIKEYKILTNDIWYAYVLKMSIFCKFGLNYVIITHELWQLFLDYVDLSYVLLYQGLTNAFKQYITCLYYESLNFGHIRAYFMQNYTCTIEINPFTYHHWNFTLALLYKRLKKCFSII